MMGGMADSDMDKLRGPWPDAAVEELHRVGGMMGGMAQIEIDTDKPKDFESLEYVCAGWAHDSVQRLLTADPDLSGQAVLAALKADLQERAEKLAER